jgi:hypothetical protein
MPDRDSSRLCPLKSVIGDHKPASEAGKKQAPPSSDRKA